MVARFCRLEQSGTAESATRKGHRAKAKSRKPIVEHTTGLMPLCGFAVWSKAERQRAQRAKPQKSGLVVGLVTGLVVGLVGMYLICKDAGLAACLAPLGRRASAADVTPHGCPA